MQVSLSELLPQQGSAFNDQASDLRSHFRLRGVLEPLEEGSLCPHPPRWVCGSKRENLSADGMARTESQMIAAYLRTPAPGPAYELNYGGTVPPADRWVLGSTSPPHPTPPPTPPTEELCGEHVMKSSSDELQA